MLTQPRCRCCKLQLPGNVRQLENICHWITVMAPGSQVDAADLPPEAGACSTTAEAVAAPPLWCAGSTGDRSRCLWQKPPSDAPGATVAVNGNHRRRATRRQWRLATGAGCCVGCRHSAWRTGTRRTLTREFETTMIWPMLTQTRAPHRGQRVVRLGSKHADPQDSRRVWADDDV